MAKARAIPGLEEHDPYGVAAAKVLAVRTQELRDLSAGVLDTSEIDRLHDMRVTTRRLRAALEVFRPCFPKKRFNAVLREVKELADALGERRDRDVAIASLGELAERFSRPDRAGVESLIVWMKGEQARANEALAPFVEPGRIAELTERLAALAAEARRAAAPTNGTAPG